MSGPPIKSSITQQNEKMKLFLKHYFLMSEIGF